MKNVFRKEEAKLRGFELTVWVKDDMGHWANYEIKTWDCDGYPVVVGKFLANSEDCKCMVCLDAKVTV